MRILVLSCAVMLTACAASAPPPAPAPEPVTPAPAAAPAPAKPAVEMAPTPYTAEEIREACPVGRKIVLRVVEKDKPEVLHVIEFRNNDAQGTDLHMTVTEPSGKVLDTSDKHVTWAELRSHAEFPKDRTVVTHRTTMTPLGALESVVYKVTEGEGPDETVSTYHFATKLPGPPVVHFVEKGGTRVMSGTMESSTTAK